MYVSALRAMLEFGSKFIKTSVMVLWRHFLAKFGNVIQDSLCERDFVAFQFQCDCFLAIFKPQLKSVQYILCGSVV